MFSGVTNISCSSTPSCEVLQESKEQDPAVETVDTLVTIASLAANMGLTHLIRLGYSMQRSPILEAIYQLLQNPKGNLKDKLDLQSLSALSLASKHLRMLTIERFNAQKARDTLKVWEILELWNREPLEQPLMEFRQFFRRPVNQLSASEIQTMIINAKGFSEWFENSLRLTDIAEEFCFSNSNLQLLPPELGRITNLVNLDLSNNNLQELPPKIGQLTRLRILKLNGNNLQALPQEIGRLTGIQELDLSDNNLNEAAQELIQALKKRGVRIHFVEV